MVHERTICVFTGSRAEYSAVYNLLREIDRSPDAQLHLLVAASHWSPEFGLTYREIVEDGFTIDSKVEMVLSSESMTGVIKAMGVGLISFADVFERVRPDVVVVPGDRYEALAVVQAAYVMGIPVAHIGGGEVSGGSLDEGFRHAITKLSKLHFVASDAYAQRVRQLGEPPDSIFVVGPPALEDLLTLLPEPLASLCSEMPLDLSQNSFALCTFHADGVSSDGEGTLEVLLAALEGCPDLQIVFSSSNADADGRAINSRIQGWCEANRQRSAFVANLGRRRYHSLLRHAAFVIGNSSSGLIEAPAAGIPTVNVGNRQSGRSMAPSIISTGVDRESIEAAITRARTPQMREVAQRVRSQLGERRTAQLMLQQLLAPPESVLGMKQFVDLAPPDPASR